MSRDKKAQKDNTNIANEFNQDELSSLGSQCYDLFQDDDESRSEWKERHQDYLEVYHQLDSYEVSFRESDDSRIPLLTESCLGFQARAYKALFPQRSFVATTSMEDITPEEVERSERVAKWMNYQLNFRQRRYKRDKKRMLLAAALMGNDFTKTYWCPMLNIPKVERVRAQDFVVSQGKGPRELEDIRRKTQIIYMDINRARQLHRAGFFTQLPEIDQNNDYTGMQQVEADAEGINYNVVQDSTMVKILEQHTWYDLDGDGIEEPVIFWIDDNSKKVLRVSARFNVNDENKTPIEYYTYYSFIDNPDGFWCFGS